ncbi:alkyl/aryl-sulfatase [Nocardioides albus]|uniref:Linear primary-alkylsulfatase n=1 Tax=Nocardioides albus TaxID=1841 RepID=A0A7W5A559_9ACTN|nr:alkyl sulfatase dimerization domain-containing protein [Nocardioides albus]MBB3089736.1 alkyl sulfatase BDS1-like metallo-beta-lactamase superfamily hydrolase [Nocardioides albus]GGU35232.1 beta-lactamase-like protein [Nocardioides albus]
MTNPHEATEHVRRQHKETLATLPFHESTEESERGLVARWTRGPITAPDGRVVWDVDTYAFLEGEAPDTVNPSLWRHSRQVSRQGLYEVRPGIHQVRGLDIANITFIAGESGVIVVDPLVSVECAAAALELYREHCGDRPVTAVILTHSHIDHFGGIRGVISDEDVAAGVPVIAPSGFLEHAVGENVFAGTAMARRAAYMFGAALERGPRGQVGAGIGQTNSTGQVSLIPPTVLVGETGEEHVFDGVRFVFQMTPDSEAPSEFHFYLPELKALCIAENSNHAMHNLLTLRGALVRDAHAWAGYLTEAIETYGQEAEVAFGGHHWPTFGNEAIREHLALQRDMYAYLHDQTLRRLNQGYTGTEIAEDFPMPPALEQNWSNRGYYGTVSHNVKAIYQRYMGWYDGNPARLWQHPPVEQGQRFVRDMGGADVVVSKARAAYEEGDFRWATTLLDHVIFAEPDHAAARELQADTFEQLGYLAESGPWRCVYLSGAHELRHGTFGTPLSSAGADIVRALSAEQIFDAIAIRVDGPRCWSEVLRLDVELTSTGERHRLTLRNGVLTHSARPQTDTAEATLRLPAPAALAGLLLGGAATPEGLAAVGGEIEGDAGALARLVATLDAPDPTFAIVTPE